MKGHINSDIVLKLLNCWSNCFCLGFWISRSSLKHEKHFNFHLNLNYTLIQNIVSSVQHSLYRFLSKDCWTPPPDQTQWHPSSCWDPLPNMKIQKVEEICSFSTSCHWCENTHIRQDSGEEPHTSQLTGQPSKQERLRYSIYTCLSFSYFCFHMKLI